MELACLSVSSTLLRFELDELSCSWNKSWNGEAESFHVRNRSDPNIVANDGKTYRWIRQLLRQLMVEIDPPARTAWKVDYLSVAGAHSSNEN